MFWIIFLPIITLIGFLLHSVVQCLSFLSTSCQQRCLKTTTVQGFCWIRISSSSPLVCLCPMYKSKRGENKGHDSIKTENYDLQQDKRFIHTYLKKKNKPQPALKHLYNHSPDVWGGRQLQTVQHSKAESAQHWLRLLQVLTSWPPQNYSATAWFAPETSVQ